MVQFVLFVCFGNICCFLLVEGVFCVEIECVGCLDKFFIDFVGIGVWYVGDLLDFCFIFKVVDYGIDIFFQWVWQVQFIDFNDFDLILVMDMDNF